MLKVVRANTVWVFALIAFGSAWLTLRSRRSYAPPSIPWALFVLVLVPVSAVMLISRIVSLSRKHGTWELERIDAVTLLGEAITIAGTVISAIA